MALTNSDRRLPASNRLGATHIESPWPSPSIRIATSGLCSRSDRQRRGRCLAAARSNSAMPHRASCIATVCLQVPACQPHEQPSSSAGDHAPHAEEAWTTWWTRKRWHHVDGVAFDSSAPQTWPAAKLRIVILQIDCVIAYRAGRWMKRQPISSGGVAYAGKQHSRSPNTRSETLGVQQFRDYERRPKWSVPSAAPIGNNDRPIKTLHDH